MNFQLNKLISVKQTAPGRQLLLLRGRFVSIDEIDSIELPAKLIH